jgi:hypothetical protein
MQNLNIQENPINESKNNFKLLEKQCRLSVEYDQEELSLNPWDFRRKHPTIHPSNHPLHINNKA